MARSCSGWPSCRTSKPSNGRRRPTTGSPRGIAAIADKLVVIDNQGLHVWGHVLGANGFVTHLSNFWPEYPLVDLAGARGARLRGGAGDPRALQVGVERLGRSGRRDQRRRGAVHQGCDGAGRLPRRAASSAGRPADAGPDGRARPSSSTRRACRASSDPDRLTDAGQAGRYVATTTPLGDVTDPASLSFSSLTRDS